MFRHSNLMLVVATASFAAQAAVAGTPDAKLWNGTWRLNATASTFGAGGVEASETRTYSFSHGMLSITSTAKDSEGREGSFSYSVGCDGKPAPIVDNPGVDSITLTCLSGREIATTSSLKGRVVAQGTAAVSVDGKHLTLTKTYVGMKGAPIETLKYDR